jgi:hypothetical protein
MEPTSEKPEESKSVSIGKAFAAYDVEREQAGKHSTGKARGMMNNPQLRNLLWALFLLVGGGGGGYLGTNFGGGHISDAQMSGIASQIADQVTQRVNVKVDTSINNLRASLESQLTIQRAEIDTELASINQKAEAAIRDAEKANSRVTTADARVTVLDSKVGTNRSNYRRLRDSLRTAGTLPSTFNDDDK